MGALSEVIQDPVRRREVVDDGVQVIDLEVKSKRGLSGMAVQAGFRVVKGVKPGIIPQALNHFLDEFCESIDPFYEDFKTSGETDLERYFVRRGGEITEALLTITDRHAQRSSHRTLRGAYGKLRPQAEKHVTAAMPRVAGLVGRHVS